MLPGRCQAVVTEVIEVCQTPPRLDVLRQLIPHIRGHLVIVNARFGQAVVEHEVLVHFDHREDPYLFLHCQESVIGFTLGARPTVEAVGAGGNYQKSLGSELMNKS